MTLVPLRNSPVFSTVIPSKIFESMGMGVPILISVPAGEAVDIVLAAKAGVAVPPEDPVATAREIARLADDRSAMAYLKSCATAAASSYSRSAQAERMLAILAQHANVVGA